MNDDQEHQEALDEDGTTGESSISGSTPDLESDDNTLDTAQKSGLYNKADEEHPAELGLDQQIDTPEEEEE